ncbi:efflux transporter outer membrane subunit [Desulfococcus sp.]|uniref:efflux transporter outer membrane subunit n=1 Tax=Desulfococcus sp. TaxID=2025834 RepID=UPI003594500F
MMRFFDRGLTRLFASVFLASMLTACMVGPDYVKPKVETPGAFKHAQARGQTPPEPMAEKWWRHFQDPVLSRLIEDAMAGNFDLTASAQRIEQARAVARISRSGLFPLVSVDPAYAKTGVSKTLETGQGGTFTTWALPLDVAYELDLFGRVRRGVEASLADAEAAVEDDLGLRLILQTDIAVNYFAMRAFDDDIRIVSRAIEVRRETLKIIKNRFTLGVISRLPVAQAEAELSATEALLLALSRDRTRLENAIAVLLGKPPAELSLNVDPLEEAPPEMPSVVPSVLLESRPDIRRAERLMAAENSRVGVAAAAFYPQVSISANAGFGSARAGDLFDAGSFTWGILPSIHIPVFEGGRNAAELDRAKARYAEAYALYRQTIVAAFGDVENALVSVALLERQQAANLEAVRFAEEAYRLSKAQFDGGWVNYLSVLDSERTFLDNRRLSSQLRGQRYLSAVALVKSIGGGWTAGAGAPALQ